jgi:hypothetical protein
MALSYTSGHPGRISVGKNSILLSDNHLCMLMDTHLPTSPGPPGGEARDTRPAGTLWSAASQDRHGAKKPQNHATFPP